MWEPRHAPPRTVTGVTLFRYISISLFPYLFSTWRQTCARVWRKPEDNIKMDAVWVEWQREIYGNGWILSLMAGSRISSVGISGQWTTFYVCVRDVVGSKHESSNRICFLMFLSHPDKCKNTSRPLLTKSCLFIIRFSPYHSTLCSLATHIIVKMLGKCYAV
jgi:hypothetical protein